MMRHPSTEGRCRQCGEAVLWARSEDGRRVAVEREPRADGDTILVRTETGKLLAFVARWRIARRKDGFSGNGYYGYLYDGCGVEEFSRYILHRNICPYSEDRKE